MEVNLKLSDYIQEKPVKPNDNAHLNKIIKDVEKLSEVKIKLIYHFMVLL